MLFIVLVFLYYSLPFIASALINISYDFTSFSTVPVIMRAKENLQEAETERGIKDVIRIEVGAETEIEIRKKIVIVATVIVARGIRLEVEMMMLTFLMVVLRAGSTGNHYSLHYSLQSLVVELLTYVPLHFQCSGLPTVVCILSTTVRIISLLLLPLFLYPLFRTALLCFLSLGGSIRNNLCSSTR